MMPPKIEDQGHNVFVLSALLSVCLQLIILCTFLYHFNFISMQQITFYQVWHANIHIFMTY